MVLQILGIHSHYIIKAHIVVLNNIHLRCLTVATEEDGTLAIDGTQVIHATQDIEEEDPITDGGTLTNGIW